LHKNNTTDLEREIIQQVAKTLNKTINTSSVLQRSRNKSIATYLISHSLSKALKCSGASIAFISEVLVHSNATTTQNIQPVLKMKLYTKPPMP
jgi:site-specific recombinase XerD